MSISERLKLLRDQKSMSQARLSVVSGVAQSVISDIETGKTTSPRVSTLNLLTNARDCAVDDLLKEG